MTQTRIATLLLAVVVTLSSAGPSDRASAAVPEQEADDIGFEAYLYLYRYIPTNPS